LIYSKYKGRKDIKEIDRLQPKQQTHPKEYNQGDTIIISCDKQTRAVYIVEGEMGRKGRVVVETDENLFTNLDHENSAEILDTIGGC